MNVQQQTPPPSVTAIPGLQGPAGAAGINAPKLLNGTGDPGNGLTAGTIIGDYYLDDTTGNLWQRETYTGTITATTVVLAGNVQWKRVSVLKGPAGQNLQLVTKPIAQAAAENQILEATTNPDSGAGATKTYMLSMVSSDGQRNAKVAVTEQGRMFFAPSVEPGNPTFWREVATQRLDEIAVRKDNGDGTFKYEYFADWTSALAATVAYGSNGVVLMGHTEIPATVTLPQNLTINCNGFCLYSFLATGPVFQTGANSTNFTIHNCGGIFHFFNNSADLNHPFLNVVHTDCNFLLRGAGSPNCVDFSTVSCFVKVTSGGCATTISGFNINTGTLTTTALTQLAPHVTVPGGIAKGVNSIGFWFTAGTTQSKALFIGYFNSVNQFDMGSIINNESAVLQSVTIQGGARIQAQNNKYAAFRGLLGLTIRNIAIIQTNRQRLIEFTGAGSKLTLVGCPLLHSDNTIPAAAVGNVVATDAYFELQNDTVVTLWGQIVVNFSTTAGTPKFINVPAGPISVDLRGQIIGNIANTSAKATMVNGVFNSWSTNSNANI